MSDPQPKHTRVALYARVSTDEQREGQTIDAQIAEIEKSAKDKGWTVTGIYKDEGWSGSLLVRPALDRLRDDATKGIFDAVIVNDVDRLARDVSHLGILKRDLERKQIQLIFRKLPGESNPTYNLMVNILGSFAEFEREVIIDRTRRGRRHKVEVRKQYVGCIAAYGYHYQRGSASDGKEAIITIIPGEANTVRQMYAWALEGMSVERIARRLTDLGIPTSRNRSVWNACTVYRILRNETYTGLWAYGKAESCVPKSYRHNKPYRRITKTGRRRKPRTEWLRVDLGSKLAIIEPSLWRRVQDRIDRNHKFSPRNAQFSYLLQGLVRCGYCGHGWAGTYCRHGEKIYTYYHCWQRTCKKARWIPVPVLEAAVWSALREALSDPKLLAKRITDAQNEISREIATAIPDKRPAAEVRLEQESSLFARYRSGQLSPQQLAEGLEAMAQRVQEPRDFENVPSKATFGQSFNEICKQLLLTLDDPTPLLRREIVRRLVTEIIVTVDRVRIRAVIPGDSDETLTGAPDGTAISAAALPLPEMHKANTGMNSEVALPPFREHRDNTRMEVELAAVLPPPPSNARLGLRQEYERARSASLAN